MSNFEDFIRYGFPGYLLICSILTCLWMVGLLPGESTFYKDFGWIVGAFTLVFGPLIGFFIHQLYFAYFDWRESYTKVSRKCIAFIVHAFLKSDPSSAELNGNSLTQPAVERLASQAWIMVTTNFEEGLKIDDLYITRLRTRRNFSHAFGSIILSSVIAVLTGIAIFLIVGGVVKLSGIIYFSVHFLLILLFIKKRREIMSSINDYELGIALLWKDHFIEYISKLARLEEENKEVLKLIGWKME